MIGLVNGVNGGSVSRKAAFAFAFSSFLIGLSARSLTTVPPKTTQKSNPLILHMYDHCPYCIRVEIYLLQNSIPYTRRLYNYGSGASPSKSGYDENGGPKVLMGTKVLPVLEVVGEGMRGESLEIISYLQHKYPNPTTVSCASEPKSLRDWKSQGFSACKSSLVRPRITHLTHLKDWSDPRDVVYAKAKYTGMGFDYNKSLASTPKLVEEMNSHLSHLSSSVLLPNSSGGLSVQSVGLSMDDICLLPDLRSLTVVDGIVWPEKVRKYMEDGCEGIPLYDEYKR
jgi:glutaredoxin 2